MVRNIVSHVDNKDPVPPQSKVETHVPIELDEPDHSNSVSLSVDSQTGVRPRGGQVMQNQLVSSWKRRARGSPSSSTF